MSSNRIVMAALLYCRLGFAVHWLRHRGKEPVSHGYQRASCANQMQLLATYKRGYNIGLHTGRVQGCRNPVVVLDLDTEEALMWARANLPISTIRARSCKGEHWYYRRPEGETRIVNRVRVDGIALDIRADEGNIVAPPSIHPQRAASGSWSRCAGRLSPTRQSPRLAVGLMCFSARARWCAWSAMKDSSPRACCSSSSRRGSTCCRCRLCPRS